MMIRSIVKFSKFSHTTTTTTTTTNITHHTILIHHHPRYHTQARTHR
jgi:hypothetical protein